MAHTPGQLKIRRSNDKHDGAYDYAIISDELGIVGEAFGHVGKRGFANAEANARLWAVAPKLLEAADAVSRASTLEPRRDSAWGKALLQLRAALAEARCGGKEGDPDA